MDFSEATSKVFDRIREVDPENVTKIIGYLLVQEQGDKEMIRLAFGPDRIICDAVEKAKRDLQQLAMRSASPSSVDNHVITHDHSVHFPAANFWYFPSPYRVPSRCWVLPEMVSRNLSPEYGNYPDSVPEIANQGGPCFALEDPELSDSSRVVASQCHRMCLPEFPVKICHYFNNGYCRHGNSCKYLHEQFTGKGYPLAHEDHMFSPGSLKKLEMEIVEILKSLRGNPLSIASLPMIYYDKYGKVLQGGGYLTESQRHGKAGHSLTRLLSRLGSICLIDRLHGQHAVMLAEDTAKYMESQNEKDDPGQVNSKSQQIYLTFPAESTFTEEDVSDYFNKCGQVEDVRIPCQQKRMFGFVTFVNSETVNMILSKGNPHFFCGACVLVKPYKEKSKLIDRKYRDFDAPMHHMLHYSSMDSKFPSHPRGCRALKYFQNQLLEENERPLEYKRIRLAKLQLARKHQLNPHHVIGSMDGLRPSECRVNLQSTECFNYLLDVLDSGITGNDKINSSEAECTNDNDSQGVRLPESPFASQVDNTISTQTQETFKD